MMLNQRTIFEIHRLKNLGLSVLRIAQTLQLNRRTITKYLDEPDRPKISIERPTKLDPFKDAIAKMLETDSRASAPVIRQRLMPLGFNGGLTILKDYLHTVRKGGQRAKVFIRFESSAGEQCQIDWGHFGSLIYGSTRRKLYCMAVIECHSRLLYLEFTHSQKQDALYRCLLNAFCFFNGTPKELVHDNMLTAVLERDGPLVRFNEAFLTFVRPFKITPIACNVGQAHEKGKVEKGAIHFIRHNFWPLRNFKDLADVQSQANYWRDHIANVRIHSTTGEKPVRRFRPETLTPLPETLPDRRDMATAKVHSDFSVRFDGNTYTVPPWLVGRQVIVKADHLTLTVYFKDKAVAVHQRSWEKYQRVELPQHHEAARKNLHKHWLSEDAAVLISLGEEAKSYLENLAATQHSLKKNLKRLLQLKDEYGSHALIQAIKRAALHRAYGADYIENILYQEMTPQREHLPVRLNQENLNRIRLQEPSLAEYDALIVNRRKNRE
jgi:transposase